MSTIRVRQDIPEQDALDFLSKHLSGAGTQSDLVQSAIRRYAKEIGRLQLRKEAARLTSNSDDLAEMQNVLSDAEEACGAR